MSPLLFPTLPRGGTPMEKKDLTSGIALVLTGAAFFAPEVAKSVFSQVMALPYHIYVLATASTDLEATRPIQYGAILVLIGLVLGTSAIGVVARSRLAARSGRQ